MTSVPITSSGLPIRAGHWTLDANHSGIVFMVRHLGLANVRGRFDRFDATLDVGETLATTTVTAEIDMSSVDTNNADRDEHLRSTDFFDTETHPSMSFRSTSVDPNDDQYRLRGDLTINGITKNVTLDVEYFGTEVFPVDQRVHAGFAATTTIRRSDFGIDFGLTLGGDKVLLGDKIKVELDLQFVEP
jgi:polyisoprenoid-binding protein YceI